MPEQIKHRRLATMHKKSDNMRYKTCQTEFQHSNQTRPTQRAIFLQIRYGFRMEKYSHILNWCGRIFIKGHTRNRECRRDCSFTKLVYPFNNKMI